MKRKKEYRVIREFCEKNTTLEDILIKILKNKITSELNVS